MNYIFRVLLLNLGIVFGLVGCGDMSTENVDSSTTYNNGTALLSWQPPTQNTDNSTLTDLAGYKVYYGTSSGDYSETITLTNTGLTSYVVENLAPTTWYFAMTAFNSYGVESHYSIEKSKQVN